MKLTLFPKKKIKTIEDNNADNVINSAVNDIQAAHGKLGTVGRMHMNAFASGMNTILSYLKSTEFYEQTMTKVADMISALFIKLINQIGEKEYSGRPVLTVEAYKDKEGQTQTRIGLMYLTEYEGEMETDETDEDGQECTTTERCKIFGTDGYEHLGEALKRATSGSGDTQPIDPNVEKIYKMPTLNLGTLIKMFIK